MACVMICYTTTTTAAAAYTGTAKKWMCNVKCGLNVAYSMLPALLSARGYKTHALVRLLLLLKLTQRAEDKLTH